MVAAPPPYRPQLALLVKQAPTGDEWFHEIKLDGFRIGVTIDHGQVTLMSRLGNPWTEGFAEVVAGAKQLSAQTALIDGELAAVQPDGRTSMRAMGNSQTVYFAFDLLFVDGQDLTELPLEERKRRLQALLGPEPPHPFRYVEHVVSDGPAFLKEACRLRLEGIVSKLRTSPYRPGARNATWQKSKCVLRQEFVIGGYEHSTVGNLGSLWLGYYDSEGRLIFAGKVGTGFQRIDRDLRASLAPLARKTAPFDVGLPKGHKIRDAIWVEPRLVAEVAFMEWTHNAHIRHGSFQGMRPDKNPRDVVREDA